MIKDTVDYINMYTDYFRPEIAIILGSGLGELAERFNEISVPYSKIPDFVPSTIEGHKGALVFAEILGRKVVMMQGRNHYYEGYSMREITYPIKILKELGVKTVIITNAAGAVNKSFRPGDLMLITDHINMMGDNPLVGPNDERFGVRFPDMSAVYNKDLIRQFDKCAKDLKINLRRGVYIASSGPSYETPAEIEMFRILGADAAGMSTVPEAIVANYCGMRVLGVSCITNYASGISTKKLDHKEVIQTSASIRDRFIKLILTFIKEIE